jgi:Rps23 Pro-64 3,4-dihydroxylase Tpa1-like proline 4-hydroxylase
MSDKFFTFSAGKYSHSDHIDPHDDKAFTKVTMDNGNIITCSREYALIYYLTKDWKKEYGGLLVDLEADK